MQEQALTVEQRLEKARMLVDKGKNRKALALYDEILAEGPPQAAVLSARAVVLDRLRRSREALEQARQAVEMAPDDITARQRLGWLLLGRNEHEQALAVFTALPESLASQVGKAASLLGLGRFAEVELMSPGILAHKCSTVEEFSDRGIFLQLLGRLGEALDAFEEAAELGPKNAMVRLRLAEIHGILGNVKALGRCCDDALAINPRFVEAYTLKARTYSGQGEVRRSDEMSLKALKADPESGEAWRTRAVVLSGFGRLEEALQAVDKGLELEPEWASLIYDRAVILAALNRHAEAAPILERLLETDSREVAIYHSLGATYLNLGQGEKALDIYRQAEKLFPLDPHAAPNQMRVLAMMNKVEEACELGRAAFPNQTENPGFLELYGQLLLRQRNFEEALPVFEQLTRLVPHHFVAWSNRGSVLYELKRFQEGLGCQNKSIQLNPHHPMPWANQGTVLQALERYEEALNSFDQALLRAPNDPRIKELRARCLQAQGHQPPEEEGESTWLVHLVDREGEHMVDLHQGSYTGRLSGDEVLQRYFQELREKGHTVDMERGVVDGEFKAVVGKLETSPT